MSKLLPEVQKYVKHANECAHKLHRKCDCGAERRALSIQTAVLKKAVEIAETTSVSLNSPSTVARIVAELRKLSEV